ncbi:MAG: YHS domain-containing protein [Arachidicoccus sp.]|nr:YHS domain-containing protein [Arachidicoccus sp.]
MKKFILISTIAACLMMVFSCGNHDNTPTTKIDSTKPKTVSMTGDTSKFTLSMMVNKKDFVCRMPLTAGIGDTVHYKGKVYGFCSKGCKESFLQDPKSYLAEK